MVVEALPDVFEGWFLGFYEFDRVWDPGDAVAPDLRGVAERARANGAREGTPFLLAPSGRADPVVNAFWRAPPVRRLSAETKRRYAFSLKVWLTFLHRIEVEWGQVTPGELAVFKEWRLSAEDNPEHVAPGSFRVDLAAIRRFYVWAAERAAVQNPVRLRAVGAAASRDGSLVLEASPAGVRRADVKWLTPEAFRLWRNIGLRGFTMDGVPAPAWRGRTEDRDVAYAEGLFGTGLRMAEWASVLTIELPDAAHRGLFRGWLASACAKGSAGRRFWMRQRVIGLTRFYLEEGSRRAAVARAQREGRYEELRDRWLLRRVHPDGRLDVVTPTGESMTVALDTLAPRLRMRLFKQGAGGLEPVWLWLNHDGLPRPKQAWHKTFDRANQRVERTMPGAGAASALWCRPHMLRHSFALRWFCIAKFVAWQRTGLLTERERRDFRDQLGDVWFLMATLLGHSSPQTTRDVYLEPFQALDVEHLLALMDTDDRAALERLVDVVASDQPRVLTGVGV
ncbi:site-specific integrase [Amycolatopsis sp. WAC 04182]|uniref:site-specific integrase n=1 Tax=Amycolatopsis sp. WAC 04182 TaxID=2203198 RepID=UPI0018F4708C|nr:site-specific integrase [Amycolatopsis sp. WAC 04182]